MAKRRGPKPDKAIDRIVVKLTLRTDNVEHVRVKKMLDNASHKGQLVIQALLGRIDSADEDTNECEDFNDGWGDAIM